MSHEAKVSAVILAGGASSRMGGRPKALIDTGEGPWVVRLIRLLRNAGCDSCWVVGGAHYEVIAAVVREAGGAIPVPCPEWREGMSASLRAGVEAVEASLDVPDGLLVTPVDLPEATLGDWRLLIENFKSTTVVTATAYGPGRLPGAPAIFPREWWPQLRQLTGDHGAREFLRTPGRPVHVVDALSLTRDRDHA